MVLESFVPVLFFCIYIIWRVHIDFLLWKWRDFVFIIQTLGDSIILVRHPWCDTCDPDVSQFVGWWLDLWFIFKKPRWTGVSTGRSYVPNYRKWHQTESPFKKFKIWGRKLLQTSTNQMKLLQSNEWMLIHKKDLSGSESLGHWPTCWEAERMDRWWASLGRMCKAID